MKTGITILAGLLAGVLVAAGILAALVFAGPDPVGLRPTPAPTLVPTVAPSPSASVGPAPSSACGSPAASGSAAAGCGPGASGSPAASANPGAAFHIGQPAPALVVPQVGGGTIDLTKLRGKAQQAWGTYALPIHFFIDKDGIVGAGALGGVGPDVFAASLQKIVPGAKVMP